MNVIDLINILMYILINKLINKRINDIQFVLNV